MFWFAAICLTAITMLAVYVPLIRPVKVDRSDAALKGALIAELQEVDIDKNSRFSSDTEASQARAEIGRRLLALDATPKTQKLSPDSSQFFALFALVPVLAVPLYLHLGRPEIVDQPMASRLEKPAANNGQEIADLIGRVEQRLKEKPDDGEGWSLIAPVYFRMGRFDNALAAYAKAIEFHKGDQISRAKLLADRAEILVAKENGAVSSEAAVQFSGALSVDPNNQKALFYMAVQREQSGNNPEDARANWQALIARFEGENPAWLPAAKKRLAALGKGPATAVEPVTDAPAINGPSQNDIEAANQMTPQERQEMIRGMVDGLAAKLAEDPKNAQGWLQLIRSRSVLGDKVQAQLELETARKQFPIGTPERAAIDTLATGLGF